MLTVSNQPFATLPIALFGKKKDEVDKGTTRKTPGHSEGARPPKKKDYEKAEEENEREDQLQEESEENNKNNKSKN